MSKQILAITFKKKKGKLVLPNTLSKERYSVFLASIAEGDKVECLLEVKSEDNTKAQLAKIHVCISEIAKEQGDTNQAVKEEIKRQCGMSYKDEEGELKFQSFSGCSKAELSDIIEVIIQMGNFLNINFEPMRS